MFPPVTAILSLLTFVDGTMKVRVELAWPQRSEHAFDAKDEIKMKQKACIHAH